MEYHNKAPKPTFVCTNCNRDIKQKESHYACNHSYCSNNHIMDLLVDKPNNYPEGPATCDECDEEISYKNGALHC